MFQISVSKIEVASPLPRINHVFCFHFHSPVLSTKPFNNGGSMTDEPPQHIYRLAPLSSRQPLAVALDFSSEAAELIRSLARNLHLEPNEVVVRAVQSGLRKMQAETNSEKVESKPVPDMRERQRDTEVESSPVIEKFADANAREQSASSDAPGQKRSPVSTAQGYRLKYLDFVG
jgi:hypothetical protein